MKAGEIMHRPVIAATRTTSARDVAEILLMGEFSGVPIAEQDGTVVGVVTELDLIRVMRVDVSLETTAAEDIMASRVTSVDVDAPVEQVMELLDTENIIRVPVTEKGKLVGLISRADVLKAMIQPKFLRFG